MTKMKKSVLIVDEETMLVDLLVPHLEMEFKDITFVKAASGKEARLLLEHHVFDIIITELFGPGIPAFSMISEMRSRFPKTRCIVLSGDPTSHWVHRAVRDGAMGFVTKTSPCREMVAAIHAVSQGMRYFSPDAAQLFMVHVSSVETKDLLGSLSSREFDIFVQIGQGRSLKAISKDLNLSIKTISVHKHNIAKKTGIDSGAKIARYCMEHGLLKQAVPQTSLPTTSVTAEAA